MDKYTKKIMLSIFIFCMPESFNMKFHTSKMTFVNSQQHEKTDSKFDFVLKTRFRSSFNQIDPNFI